MIQGVTKANFLDYPRPAMLPAADIVSIIVNILTIFRRATFFYILVAKFIIRISKDV